MRGGADGIVFSCSMVTSGSYPRVSCQIFGWGTTLSAIAALCADALRSSSCPTMRTRPTCAFISDSREECMWMVVAPEGAERIAASSFIRSRRRAPRTLRSFSSVMSVASSSRRSLDSSTAPSSSTWMYFFGSLSSLRNCSCHAGVSALSGFSGAPQRMQLGREARFH